MIFSVNSRLDGTARNRYNRLIFQSLNRWTLGGKRKKRKRMVKAKMKMKNQITIRTTVIEEVEIFFGFCFFRATVCPPNNLSYINNQVKSGFIDKHQK
mmetsp:Transcript_60535/g.148527  ORF Transcript_60535/g.148527 Transcript_60535/m.148527 type:complete len:98 (+) Transcript_60535:1439-1732(+)